MDETKTKQAYLRKEIIDRGYDSQAFADFLQSQKENGRFGSESLGDDIDNWSVRSLELQVHRFQEENQKRFEEGEQEYRYREDEYLEEDESSDHSGSVEGDGITNTKIKLRSEANVLHID